MRTWIACLLIAVAAPAFAAPPAKMKVTWPNGGNAIATYTTVDDSDEHQSAFIKTTAIYKYDMLGKSPPGFPVVALAKLRVKFYSNGQVAVKWASGLGGEGGIAVADGSIPFTVKLTDYHYPNQFKIVTVTPIP